MIAFSTPRLKFIPFALVLFAATSNAAEADVVQCYDKDHAAVPWQAKESCKSEVLDEAEAKHVKVKRLRERVKRVILAKAERGQGLCGPPQGTPKAEDSANAAGKAATDWIPLLGEDWYCNWIESRFYKRSAPKDKFAKKLFRMKDGVLHGKGKPNAKAHMYYAGPLRNASFKNFEVKIEIKLAKRGNGGFYFYTHHRQGGWAPGLEIKFNNTHRQRDKTGSVHGHARVKRSSVRDEEWFELHLSVNDGYIVSKINGKKVAEWRLPPDKKYVDGGTFALQRHTNDIWFRNMRIRVLPDG